MKSKENHLKCVSKLSFVAYKRLVSKSRLQTLTCVDQDELVGNSIRWGVTGFKQQEGEETREIKNDFTNRYKQKN